MTETVVAAMSGGVDSSVAAALLKEMGYEVIGIGLRLVDEGMPGEPLNRCCGIRDMDDARRVAQRLSIPFYVLNFKRVFRETVIDYFLRSYLQGETPNPCVVCNEVVKFEVLLRTCRALGASYLATGHYARVVFDRRSGRYLLMKGRDRLKDQSYFLYSLSQYQLAHALFPLGEITKRDTRALAGRFGLGVHDKRESQDLCFVGEEGYGALVREYAGGRIKPGPIVDESGEVVGRHGGIPFYTVGQRRGLGIPGPERRYVAGIDPEKNTITISRSREALRRDRLTLREVNYVSVDRPDEAIEVVARVRYRGPEIPALLIPMAEGKAIVEFYGPQEITAPGQSVVLYRGDSVIAGGIATRS